MTQRHWVLTDVDARIYVEHLTLPREALGADRPIQIVKERLRGGLSDGVDQIRVDTGDFSFVLLPTRGMSLWKAWHGGREIGWKSPVPGPVHPAFTPVAESSGLGFLDGFDELLVRCGLESNGAPEFDDAGRVRYPLHGRIGNLPARRVEVRFDPATGRGEIAGVVDEVRFHFQKLRLTSTLTFEIGRPWLAWRDEVTNLSDSPAGVQLLYHVNFGQPLLEAGARVVAPLKTLVPRNARAVEGLSAWNEFAAPAAGYAEQVYFCELHGDAAGRTATLLHNAVAEQGVLLRFNTRQLPCFSLWKNTTSLRDGYVTGLEPATNYPNPRSYEARQGRVVELAPGASTLFELELESLSDAPGVQAAQAEIAALGSAGDSRTLAEPCEPWCAP